MQAQAEIAEVPSPAALPEPAPFEGRDWRLGVYWDGSKSAEVLKDGRPTLFRFAGGELTGSGGCNRIQGQYRAAGETFQLVSGLVATRMLCPQHLMQQESSVISGLQAARRYRLLSERLELIDEGGRMVLGFFPVTPDPGPQPLVGPTWLVERFVDAQGSWVRPAARIDLRLDPQGQISGFDGCSRYLSGFKRSGQALAIGPIAATGSSCPGGRALAQQAQDLRAALMRVQAYRIAEGRLILLDETGQPLIELSLSPQEGQGP